MLGAMVTAFVMMALAGSVCAQGWRHQVRDFPSEAVEGSTLRFRIAYSAPTPAKLHAELKDAGNVVHVVDVRDVSGEGVADVSVLIPEGKFGGHLLAAVWFGDDWREPRIPIIHVGPIPVFTAAQGKRLASDASKAVAMRTRLRLDRRSPVVAVLSGGWAGRSSTLTDAYVRALSTAGHRCVRLGPEETANRGVLSRDFVSLLVLPEAQSFPGEALPALLAYLRSGGHLIALGAPAFDRLVRKLPSASGDEWVDELQVSERIRNTPADTALLSMAAMDRDAWRRSSNDMASLARWQMEDAGAPIGRAIHHEMDNMTGWDTLLAPLTRAAGPEHNLVTFRAKGGDQTTSLAVELTENDGSRWIGTVSLTRNWRRFALPATAFALWDPDHTSGRGQGADRVRLDRIASVSIGLALTHTSLAGGKHEYWFADLGAASGPELERFAIPTLDTLSPAYKCYPVRGATTVDASGGAALISSPAPAMPRNVLSTHPRPQGTGFGKERKYRWVPLLQLRGPQGVAGTLATLMVHLRNEFAGGRWAAFTAAEPTWYARPDVRRYVVELAGRMVGAVPPRATAGRRADRPMFAEAGAEYYGYFADEAPLLGARVVGAGSKPLKVRFVVKDSVGAAPVFDRTLPVKGVPDGAGAEVRWKPQRLTSPRYTVTATLLLDGRAIDVLSHEVTVRLPVGSGRPADWVTVRDGQFLLQGKPWYPHGVNYMPSSGIAAEDGHYFEKWISSESYDPVVIERDLSRVRAAGFDHISAFIYTECTNNHNLIDLLNRCDAHGLRVNLSLRPGTPLDFEGPAIGEIIKANRLADDPTVFAYDLAWEPAWGYRDQRRRWDGQWAEWLRQRYGSAEAAEKDLGEKLPREAGKVAGPSDADVTAASTIPKVVAAYRRFQDDFLSRKHMEARQKIRTLDTRHLLSFRMSIAGDPTCGPTIMPYDFTGLARSMDFMSPEGYGRIGEKAQVRPGWFTAAYSRMVAPGKPILWAEFGYTIWNKGEPPAPEPGLSFADAFDRRSYLQATIDFTERYYRAFYEMTLESGASGTVCWWYPGGYRFGENSDFGIINPDGTWRGLTRIIAENAKRFANRPLPKTPDAWIDVDRDRHPDGIYGIYTAHRDEFWRLVDSGKFPGLRMEGPGSDSAGTPLVAVGNVRSTGMNPPKHLNAEFESVQVEDADGRWVDIPYAGGSVSVKAGAPVHVRVVAGNSGVAKWLAGDSTGSVRVAAFASDQRVLAASAIASPVASLGTSSETGLTLPAQPDGAIVDLQMEAKDRCRFGERRTIRLRAL